MNISKNEISRLNAMIDKVLNLEQLDNGKINLIPGHITYIYNLQACGHTCLHNISSTLLLYSSLALIGRITASARHGKQQGG